MSKVHVLTIAGSDPSGGAGVMADIKTFSALGAYSCCTFTALVAQNTQGVQSIFPVTPRFLQEQCDSVFTDVRIDAVKIGMLADVEIIKTVASVLDQYKPSFVVFDPVMVAKGGAHLLQESAVSAIIEYLLPRVDIITPNLPEAAAILGSEEAKDFEQMQEQAHKLHAMGIKNILVKGGHLSGKEARDCLIESDGQVSWFTSDRIDTKHTHGTGCTLSAAIAALYPREKDLKVTVEKAKDYLYHAILAGKDLGVGKGIGPLHHFYQTWSNVD